MLANPSRPTILPGAARALGVLLGVGLLAACGPGAAPPIELAARFDPAQLQPVEEGTQTLTQLLPPGGSPWLEIPVPEGSLEETPWPGVYRATLPALGARRSFAHDDLVPRLADVERQWLFSELTALSLEGLHADPAILQSRSFTIAGEDLMLVVPPGDVMPGELLLGVPLFNGRRLDGRWRVSLGELGGDGLAVWPGERWETGLESAGRRRLLTTVAADGLLIPDESAREPVTWSVQFDGETLASGKLLAVHGDVQFESIAIELPRRAGTLGFEVRGADVRSAFLSPRIEALPTSRAKRRPDVALFLADTFRADLLGYPTGLGSLTPHLDRFAEGAAQFERTWSSSSWTLPAHSSMFTGLQPTQHGAMEQSSRLSDDAYTLAERLRGLGYRTLALTDGAFVSRAFGIDQGFEIFLEESEWGNLELGFGRLERFLDSADDRPLFLFFHTFRTHVPYFVDPDTEARLGEALGIRRNWAEISQIVLEQAAAEGVPLESLSFTPKQFQEALALYRGGAADLDRGFARWLDILGARGLDKGLILFTSDHGEAFGEHDGYHGHSGDLWDEQTRVPLLIRGPGVVPGRSLHPASLVDIPRTIFALLDLSPAPAWGGRALLGPRADKAPMERTVELFATPTSIALVERGAKLHAKGQTLELTSVHDLDRDPREQSDDRERHGAWAEGRLLALNDDETRWRVPILEGASARMRPELALQLAALGYTGD